MSGGDSGFKSIRLDRDYSGLAAVGCKRIADADRCAEAVNKGYLADSDCPNIEVVSAFEFDYNSTIEMLLNCT